MIQGERCPSISSSSSTAKIDVFVVSGPGQIGQAIGRRGLSPSQVSPETILNVDSFGTALVLEKFGIVARGGAGVDISSQSGHRPPPLMVEQQRALAMTRADDLNGSDFLMDGGVTAA